MAFSNTTIIGVACVASAALVYLLYQRLLPRPIPGIPYNVETSKSILGDAGAFLKTGRPDPFNWIIEQGSVHNSPITQVFMRPGRGPWVVITDFWEANDIMTRRTREFDRSEFFGNLFVSLMPKWHGRMLTGEQWKDHRRMIGDLMASTFLNETMSVRIEEGTQDLLRLWEQKHRLVGSTPFNVKQEIGYAALDIVWTSTFGSKIGVTEAQIAALEGKHQVDVSSKRTYEFSLPPLPAAFNSILKLTHSIEIATTSPFPVIHHTLALNLEPKLRAARKHKDALIDERLQVARQKFSKSTDASKAKSAIDLLVQRETALAQKATASGGRVLDSAAIKDELFGFLIAAHDTSGASVAWALKYLALHQTVQDELRRSLFNALEIAATERRAPRATEIAGSSGLAYLEAFIEEVHRCGRTVPSVSRRAKCDTEILGHKIPKGTDVFLHLHGPSYETPAIPIDDKLRSESGLKNRDRPPWNSDDIQEFKPERWLVRDDAGGLVFNPRAGPSHGFGAGPRGCFGRKLATLQLKIMLTLIVWNFRLLPIPSDLSSFRPHDVLVGEPEQCYVSLEKIKL